MTQGSRSLGAVLWDMDGLLVDSEPVWTIAEQELAVLLGGTWSDALKARIVGTRLDVAVPTILAHYGRNLAETAWACDWLLTRMVELFGQQLTVLPGVRELLAELQIAGVPVALVSSSYRVLVDAVVRSGFTFDLTLAGDEVRQGKPDPEPYLTAARLLGVPPGACLVLEDSGAGVRSGLAAGCAVLAVPSVSGVRFDPAARLTVRGTLAGMTVNELRGCLG